MKLGILNDFNGNYKKYEDACNDLKIDYEIIDITSSNWISQVESAKVDGVLVRPQVNKQVYKDMFDERVYFINKIMNIPIYPSYDELFIYEDKKRMSYFLKTHNINHAETFVFYDKKSAESYINTTNYPIVFKTNNGSASIGVKYIKNKNDAKKIINKAFTKFKIYNRGITKWKKTKWKIKYPILDDKQKNFVIFQEKVEVNKEWRVIKIGKSYFAHEKLSDGKFHSGSLKVRWTKPPIKLLNMAKEICEMGSFNSMAIDIFEVENEEYIVNELQTIFGSYNDSQMYIDGVPGRYIFQEEWIFEEGYFNKNSSFDLRVIDFINQLKNSNN